MFMSYLLYVRLGCHLCADAAALLAAANVPASVRLPQRINLGGYIAAAFSTRKSIMLRTFALRWRRSG